MLKLLALGLLTKRTYVRFRSRALEFNLQDGTNPTAILKDGTNPTATEDGTNPTASDGPRGVVESRNP